MALNVADRGYVIERGEVALTGSGNDLLNDPQVKKAYLGVA
jgi:branched-chain amino acid transport system ATP-binding protein